MGKARNNEAGWLHGTRSRRMRRAAVRLAIDLLALIGMAIIYYLGFSLLFDTPLEYRMKNSTAKLEKEYKLLNERYDSLMIVLDNVVARDRGVFKALFESEPYDLDAQYAATRWAKYENLLARTSRELGDEFFSKSETFEKSLSDFDKSYMTLEQKAASMGDQLLYIPAIQPVVNKDLTLLTASYGMRIHPFYKTLASHQGVDFSVPEGTRVFATADGTVKDVQRLSTSGTTVVVSHGNGYETTYAHLGQANVRKGERVKRGDIIALSGNSGLSLAPHLHYEVSHNGMRVDPLHYFFMELTPADYQKMIKIAQTGMQSFD